MFTSSPVEKTINDSLHLYVSKVLHNNDLIYGFCLSSVCLSVAPFVCKFNIFYYSCHLWQDWLSFFSVNCLKICSWHLYLYRNEQWSLFYFKKGMICMKTNLVYNFRFLRKSKSLPLQIIASTEIHEKVMPKTLGAWSTINTNMNHKMW